MGSVVQEIMEMHDGEVPVGYTLSDYFKDVQKKNQAKTTSERREGGDNLSKSNEEKSQNSDG